MGFRFRKSIGAGPFRINFSKSGIGYSFGGKGARITKKANGNTMTTLGIPGTGISYVSETSNKKDTKIASKETLMNNNKQPKDKKPFYKKWWFWMIIGACALGGLGSTTEEPSTDIDKTTTSIIETVTTETTTIEEIITDIIETTTKSQPIETTSKTQTTKVSVDSNGVFYITEHGEKYHKASCRHIKNRESYAISKENAQANYEPCGTCHP